MAEYQVKSDKPKKFTLMFNDKLLGNLLYDNWFSLKSEIILADDTRFRIEPTGYWGNTIEVKSNENTLISFRLDWNNTIIIKPPFGNDRSYFIFKQKDLLKSHYILLDGDKNELLAVRSDYMWSKLNYDYNITTSDDFEKLEDKDLFLLSVIHCTNYYITMMIIAAI